MVIKYCPDCSGKPYTKDINKTTCPVCGNYLYIESVDESMLIGRPELPAGMSKSVMDSYDEPNEYDQPYDPPAHTQQGYVEPYSPDPVPVLATEEREENERPQRNSGRNQDNEIIGTIYGYSCSKDEAGNYRRLIFTRLIDAVVYNQRMDDVLHRFVVRPENNEGNDIPVVVHGTIAAGSGLNNNALVRVQGRYKHGTLYARRINVRTGNYESPVRIQFNFARIFIVLLSFIMLFAGTYLFVFQRDAVDGFFAAAKTFLSIFAIVFLILFVISLIIISRSRFLTTAGLMMRRGTGIFLIIDIVISFFITLGIYSRLTASGLTLGASLGATFAAMLSSFAPIIIMIIGIIILFMAIFR